MLAMNCYLKGCMIYLSSIKGVPPYDVCKHTQNMITSFYVVVHFVLFYYINGKTLYGHFYLGKGYFYCNKEQFWCIKIIHVCFKV